MDLIWVIKIILMNSVDEMGVTRESMTSCASVKGLVSLEKGEECEECGGSVGRWAVRR
jgi:rRNA maturation endonuclease Nob1